MLKKHLSAYILTVLTALLQCQQGSSTNVGKNVSMSNCEHHLHGLAEAQKNFLQCATLHSVPVNLCLGCEPKYSEMVVAYGVIIQNCSDIYLNKDRVNIVPTTQAILEGLWTKAYCDDCFESNNSEIFDDKRQALDGCIILHKENVCAVCLSAYKELNEFYTSLDKHNNNAICYDLQDAMNRTRSKWSKEYNCCNREFKILYFSIAASICATLVCVFYAAAYGLTKYSERNHNILNEGPQFETPIPIPRAPNNVGNNVQQTQQPQEPPPTATTTKRQYSVLEEDSDSDDGILPTVDKGKKLQ